MATRVLLVASLLSFCPWWMGTLAAQSRLLGDTYLFSATNFDGNIGETEDPVTREIIDHGTPPVELTFDGIPETAGGMIVNESVTAFPGIPGGIHAENQAGIDGVFEFDLTIWENAGELVQFDFQTVDGGYISDEVDTSAITMRELDWANSDPGSFPAFFSELSDEQGDFFLYYSKDGVPVTGYEIQLDVGLLVGPHPTDPNVPEVVYIAYSDGQVNELAARFPGGLDMTYGTSQLNEGATWEDLAYAVGIIDQLDGVNGLGFGFLIDPPTGEDISIPGDVNLDGAFNTMDFDDMGRALREGLTLPQYDVNGDGNVDAADKTYLIETIGNTYFGDANFDGEFNSGDFVKVFTAGQYEDTIVGNSVWETGDWNTDTEFNSGDFVVAFQAGGYELGPRAAVNAVPEPSSMLLVLTAALLVGGVRRRGHV